MQVEGRSRFRGESARDQAEVEPIRASNPDRLDLFLSAFPVTLTYPPAFVPAVSLRAIVSADGIC